MKGFYEIKSVDTCQTSAENVLIIPKRALKTYVDRTYVKVLVDGEKKEKDVVAGLESDTLVEIKEGLDEGDLVIVD